MKAGVLLSRILLVVTFLTFAGAWHWTSLHEYASAEKIATLAQALKSSAAAPAIVVATYALAGLVVFPVTVLIVATALLFDPLVSILRRTWRDLCMLLPDRHLKRDTAARPGCEAPLLSPPATFISGSAATAGAIRIEPSSSSRP